MSKSIYLEDENGNIQYYGDLRNNEMLDIKKNLTEEQIVNIKNRSKTKYWCREWGGFVTMCYVKDELLFSEINISPANIPRIIYLATYVEYNDKEEGLLVKKRISKGVKHLRRNDIRDILKLTESTFKVFMREMKSLELIYQVDDKYYINPKYFTKGKVDFNKGEYTRIFIEPMKTLYENCNPKQHKQLSYVFRLIPYMNYETNIICTNINERDMNKIDWLGLKEVCKLLGIDYNHSKRLERDLLSFYVTLNNDKYYLFSRVIIRTIKGDDDYFAINPCVTWKGGNMDIAHEVIKGLFFR